MKLTYKNQIINVEYVNRNDIKLKLFKYYPLLYYIELAEHNPTWYSLGRQVCNITEKRSYSYNVLDLFDQCQKIVNKLDEKWYKSKYSEIEYLCLVTLFRNFTYAMFYTNKTNFLLQKRVLKKIKHFIDDNFINWHRNEWLYSKKNKNDPTYLDYLREFKRKFIKIHLKDGEIIDNRKVISYNSKAKEVKFNPNLSVSNNESVIENRKNKILFWWPWK